jgi:hypothetical protein
MGYGNYIQNGPPRGSAKAQGSKAKSTNWVSTAQSKQSLGQSDTKDGQQLVLPRTPNEGTRHPQALYMSPGQVVSIPPCRVN